MEKLVRFVVIIVVAGLIYWVLNWALVNTAPPEPFFKIGQVVLVLGTAVVVCYALLDLAGFKLPRWPGDKP